MVSKQLPGRRTWDVAAVAWGLGTVAYLACFFLLPATGGWRRGSLWPLLLVPDDVVASWLGDDGGWAVADRLPILAGALALHITAYAAGWLALSRVSVSDHFTRLERTLLAHGLGLSSISLFTLALGLLGALQESWQFIGPMAALWMAAAAVSWRSRQRRSVERNVRERRPTAPARAPWKSQVGALARTHGPWLLAGLPFAFAAIGGGMLPPIEFDVREYHLQAPKEFFQLGGVTFLPHNVYANMPLGSEMWPLAAMSATGDWWLGALIGKTVIASLLPIGAGTIYALCQRLHSLTAGAAAALVYLTFPWLLHVSALGLIEGVVAYYVSLALLPMVVAHQSNGTLSHGDRNSLAAFAGFFAGSAAACKYPALVFVVLPFAAWTAWAARRHGMRVLLARTSVFLLAAAAACGPWLLKNWVLTGNPIYPLFSSVFDGATRTPAKDAQFLLHHRPHGFGISELAVSTVQVLLTSRGLSPLLWPFVALAAWQVIRGGQTNRSRYPALILLSYAALVFACWWLFTHRIDRFWLPGVPVLAIVAGYSVASVKLPAMRWTIAALASIGWTWSLIAAATPMVADNRYLAPLAELRTSPERIDPWHLYLNAHTPTGSAVLTVGDAEVFDLTPPVYYNTVFDDSWFVAFVNGRSPTEIKRSLADRHIAFVYVHWGEIARYRSTGNYGFDDFTQPEVFAKLVADGVLLPPLRPIVNQPGQVFPAASEERPSGH